MTGPTIRAREPKRKTGNEYQERKAEIPSTQKKRSKGVVAVTPTVVFFVGEGERTTQGERNEGKTN